MSDIQSGASEQDKVAVDAAAEQQSGAEAGNEGASSESSQASPSSSPATGEAAVGGDTPNADASSAASQSESGTSSSAPAASPSADAAGTAASDSAKQAAASTAIADPDPAVNINVEDHAEARDRFAGLMARLHRFEAEAVEDLKEDLRAIGTLLHLHSVASGHADANGDYKSSDL